jgi:hypothetical protein
MKKLTLLIALTLTNILFSQGYSNGCGWTFESTSNYMSKSSKFINKANGNIEFHFSRNCDNLLEVINADGSRDVYYTENKSFNSGYTSNGNYYEAFNIYDTKNHLKVILQAFVVKRNGIKEVTSLRMFFKDGYNIEFL